MTDSLWATISEPNLDSTSSRQWRICHCCFYLYNELSWRQRFVTQGPLWPDVSVGLCITDSGRREHSAQNVDEPIGLDVNSKQLNACALILGLVLLGGCSRGPSTNSVTGTVTMDNAPLSGASVIFTSPTIAQAALGTTDAQGKFAVAYMNKLGAPAANYTVSISKQVTSVDEGTTREVVPARYNLKTTLTANVVKGEKNDFTFKLTSEKGEMDQPTAPGTNFGGQDDRSSSGRDDH